MRLDAVWLAAAILLFTGVIAGRSTGQTPQQPELRSTMSGVYTTAQAARGEDTYMSLCVACHPPATYTGAAFATAWGERPLSDLFVSISDNMPKNEPGALTPQEYAQTIAYMLKLNSVPAGQVELPADAEALKKIRIETPVMRRSKAGG